MGVLITQTEKKMNKMVVLAAAIAMTVAFGSCKSKQSAYRQAYEQAKEREIAQAEDKDMETRPIVSKPATNVQIRQEKLSAYSGEDASRLDRFSVVVGSFRNATNARSLKERLESEGYTPILAENEQGMLRVIVASFPSREEAIAAREAVKERYAPNFQDAWLLERAN
ncbi:cell division protein [Porphyromonas gingivalis SJD2]|nr:sporulation and cell division repeat protein [Porphyromonas gingivalis F0570]ERJ67253.1 sporulation and cell division repeat protein [Porphyromonas gingivalis F0569]ERJ67883.1 sporulation and cell division repeat protein [Porphyromonas gingivalis F0568]ERJ81537.1 sporulation and cell division repeat protein [Porphyromonas gingivalis F0185]ERJ88937.1 sporulation and cell division repeat protein [Porphyromonas gingivalis F0566]ERJ89646.1 sporulation and cell division repeat protein [Porphyrom